MESIQPGDLIFWGAGSRPSALYIGGARSSASSSQNSVVQRGIWGGRGAARVT
jgi:cell wall-associated NlpC family hydrolase